MTHWSIEHSAKVAIGVLVVAALGYGGVIVHNTARIPDLEQASLKQARDIAYLKATMVTLMQQTGHPPTMGDLERLLSSVGEFGARTAPFVKSAHLVITGEPLAYYHWVPPRVQDSLQRHLGPYDMAFSSSNTPTMTTDRPQVIGAMITHAMLLNDSGTWTYDGAYLRGTFKTATILLVPKDTSTSYVTSWITDANRLRVNLGAVSEPRAPIPKHPQD